MSGEGREPWLRAADPEGDGASWVEVYRRYILIAAAIVITAFALAIWYAYDQGNGSGETPLVRADTTPIRRKPDNPGGLEVPDRDKLVYNRVRGDDVTEPVQLNAGPELPVAKPEPKEPEAPAIGAEYDRKVAGGVEVPDTEPDAALLDEPVTAAVTAEPEPVKPEPAKPEPAKPEPAKPAPAPAQTPAPASAPAAVKAGGYAVQLGAFGTEAAASQAWVTAQAKHASLKKLTMEIAPLAKDGKTLYRLRGAGLAEKAAADAVCASLKAAGQACFPVAR